MLFRAAEIAAGIGGRLSGPDVDLTSVTQDSREVVPGSLFVALEADRDGHDFLEAAAASGAGAALVSKPIDATAVTQIIVPDTAVGLLRLGSLARDRVGGPVIGVTGSVGKTTTKDFLASVMAAGRRAHANTRSFNNEIGVPLTLVNAPDQVDAVVVEMGARHPGDIAALCEVARPTIGIITTVGAAHTGVFGSVAAIAKGKGELYEALPPDGCAVVNADNALVVEQAGRTAARTITFGDAGEVRASGVTVDEQLRPTFRLESPWGRVDVSLGAAGVQSVPNALAAAAAALVADVPLDLVAEQLGRAQISPWRMEVRRAASGAMVINDSYNANPISMRAALQSLAAAPGARKVAVLGLMAELDDEAAAHREMAGLARELGIELVAFDTALYGGEPVPTIDDAVALIGPLDAQSCVLVKGSRVAGLEQLAEQLA